MSDNNQETTGNEEYPYGRNDKLPTVIRFYEAVDFMIQTHRAIHLKVDTVYEPMQPPSGHASQ